MLPLTAAFEAAIVRASVRSAVRGIGDIAVLGAAVAVLIFAGLQAGQLLARYSVDRPWSPVASFGGLGLAIGLAVNLLVTRRLAQLVAHSPVAADALVASSRAIYRRLAFAIAVAATLPLIAVAATSFGVDVAAVGVSAYLSSLILAQFVTLPHGSSRLRTGGSATVVFPRAKPRLAAFSITARAQLGTRVISAWRLAGIVAAAPTYAFRGHVGPGVGG